MANWLQKLIQSAEQKALPAAEESLGGEGSALSRISKGETALEEASPSIEKDVTPSQKLLNQGEASSIASDASATESANSPNSLGGQEIDDTVDPVRSNLMKTLLANKGKLGALGLTGGGLAALGLSPDEPQAAKMASVTPSLQFPGVSNNGMASSVQPRSGDQFKSQDPTSSVPSTVKQLATKGLPSDKDEDSDSESSEQEPSKVINFGDDKSINTVEKLKQAQDERNSSVQRNQIGKAGALLGSALAGVKAPGAELYDDNIKEADNKLAQVQAQMDKEKSDPNSPFSKGVKDYIKQAYGYDIKGDVSADQLKGTVMEPIMKQYEDNQKADLQQQLLSDKLEERKQEAQLKYADLASKAKDREALYDQKKSDAMDKETTKRFDVLNNKLTSDLSSSRTVFGRAANNIRGGEAIEQLVSQIKDPNNLTTRQINELSKSLDSMLSTGASTVSGTNHLIPSSWTGDASKIAEYITNIPQGAQQGEFVKQALETVQREKDLAKQQLQRGSGALLGTSKDLMQRDPSKFKQMLQSHRLPEDIFDNPPDVQIGNTQTAVKLIKPATLTDYATKHNMSEDDARALLSKQGYKVQ